VRNIALRDEFHPRIEVLQHQAESWTPQQVLRWAFDSFGRHVAISSAFGSSGMVVIDMAARLQSTDFRLFTLDTAFLFPETQHLMQRIEQKYGIAIERVYAAQSPQEQERELGEALWSRDPDLCCKLRKVEPLQRKLSQLAAWITSIRRDQTAARSTARKIEWDAKFGLVKINPIADWSEQDVWRYIHDHAVPYNPLHDQDYPSIGCTHCTRPVLAGEEGRSGRWAGFGKTECGLHVIDTSPRE
jgi:phosphoadenosine phosphosulfate reductase